MAITNSIRMRFITVLLCLFSISLVSGQQKYPMGLVLDDEEYLSIAHASENIQVDVGRKAVPRKLDLSLYCPEVRNQGDISSCVGWSAGYAAMTIERAIMNGWTEKVEITENANSALFVYNQLTSGDCLGVRMPRALQLMADKGNCLAREYDFDINDCGAEVPQSLIQKAQKFRIDEYIRLFDPQESPEDKIRNVKLVISQQKPVIVGMKVLNNFYDIQRGDQSWIPTIGDRTYAGGHAMVVVGYDDDRFFRPEQDISPKMRGAFKIMNSWGKNWGEEGFIWVRYAHFGEYCRHAYALMLSGGQPIDFEADMTPESEEGASLRNLAGSFGFKQFTGEWFNGKPIFKEQKVRLQGSHYILSDRKVGEQFQLYVRSDFDKGYIYVFSVDPQGKSEIHFPKSEQYNTAFAGLNESALLLSGGSILTIPSRKSTLTISHPGQDYLVVLFSEKKIKPRYIEYLSDALAEDQEILTEKLPRLLKKHMIPFGDITYDHEKMGFEVSTRSSGKIVPIILAVESS